MILYQLKNNPPFTGDTELDPGGEEEVKEPKLDEDKESEASTDEKGEEETQGGDEPEPDLKDIDKKKGELDALDRDLDKIKQGNEEHNKLVEERREAITEQRRIRRENKEDLRTSDQKEDATSDDISDISQDDITRLERVLKAKGYVPKDELTKEIYSGEQKAIEQEWFDAHPEYSSNNDPNDVLYNALHTEYKLFAQPTSVRQIKTILDRAHREVASKFPNRFPQTKGNQKESQASKRRMDIAGTGTGTSGSSTKAESTNPLTQNQKQSLLDGGFSEEEVADMEQ